MYAKDGYPPIYDEIGKAVRKLGRDLQGGVLPRHVQAFVALGGAEFTYRRYMGDMWRAGLLRRIGGDGSRRGYRALTRSEVRMRDEIPVLLSSPHPLAPSPERSSLTGRGWTVEDLAVRLGLRVALVSEFVGFMVWYGAVVVDGEVVRLPSALERMVFNRLRMFPV